MDPEWDMSFSTSRNPTPTGTTSGGTTKAVADFNSMTSAKSNLQAQLREARATMTLPETPPLTSAVTSDPSLTPKTSKPHKTSRPYTFIEHIGSGSFGDIYRGRCNSTGKVVAIKLEPNGTRSRQLQKEFEIYAKYLDKVTGFPQVYDFTVTRKHSYFGMTLLERTLDQLHGFCGRTFDDVTSALLGVQLVRRLRDFHQATGHVHRDIKPENLMFAKRNPNDKNNNNNDEDGEEETMYLVDLGLAIPFRDANTGLHIEDRNVLKSLTGTARYASVRGHRGQDQSRRDDLESAAYMLIYLRKGRLPWQGMKGSSKAERYAAILRLKEEILPEELCHGLPNEFLYLLKYAKHLDFEKEPDYHLIIQMFEEMAIRCSEEEKPRYEWNRPLNTDDMTDPSI